MIRLIAAINTNRVLGDGDKLLWDIPGDLNRFRRLARTGPNIMGRKTWDSLPYKPLKGRLNIVISRDPSFEAPGAKVADSFERGLEIARKEGTEDIWVIGGSAIYELALPCADQLDLTYVHDTLENPTWPHFPPLGDFEEIPNADPQDNRTMTENGITYEFVTLRRRPSANAS
jgi:dihydrofolate reductase